MFRVFLSTICFLVLVISSEISAQTPSRLPSRTSSPVAVSRVPASAGASTQMRAPARCGYGDDARCDRRNELDITGRIRQMEYQERARLGADYCLYHKDEPQCKHAEIREAQRSGLELQKFCTDNADAPRCIGFNLSPGSRMRTNFFDTEKSGEKSQRDDFFDSSLGKPLPEPDDVNLFGD